MIILRRKRINLRVHTYLNAAPWRSHDIYIPVSVEDYAKQAHKSKLTDENGNN